MISNRDTAKLVVDTAFALTSGLDRSVARVMETSPEAEVVAYRRAVGFVMAETAQQILNPLLREHPDLVPEDWKPWFK